MESLRIIYTDNSIVYVLYGLVFQNYCSAFPECTAKNSFTDVRQLSVSGTTLSVKLILHLLIFKQFHRSTSLQFSCPCMYVDEWVMCLRNFTRFFVVLDINMRS